MEIRTKAIVLYTLKYSDSSLIAHSYTEALGKQSFILKGILTKKRGGIRKAQFQPLTQQEILFNYRDKKELQFLKEVKVIYPYQTIPNRIDKSALVQFLAEILRKAIREEEANTALFTFLETTLRYLDTYESVSNFHLIFLINLTKHLGFFPNDKESLDGSYFDLETGCFTKHIPLGKYTDYEQTRLLRMLLGMNFDSIVKPNLDRVGRRKLLDALLQYYELHLLGFSKPKSTQIFNEIFDGIS